MGRVAFLFAGQGAQVPGMGKSFYDNCEASRKVFETADLLRPGTSKQCFEGTAEELKETKNTQPCLLTVELAIAQALTEAGIHADVTAGFSLGELSALTYAKAFDLETGIRLVMKRGALMQEASEKQDTSMAAVLKLSNEDVEKVCAQFSQIYPVNYNCPGQVSVSGAAAEMNDFYAAVKEAGGRALPLKVSGAFHSPFMAEAAAEFAKELAAVSFQEPVVPIYSNFTGEEYPENICEILSQQIDHPVKWEMIIRAMIRAGVDTFVELGPGTTLTGFMKKIDPSVKAISIAEFDNMQAAIEEMRK